MTSLQTMNIMTWYLEAFPNLYSLLEQIRGNIKIQ